uniref:Cyclin N-terminal domain-containing protein n=1 Tax=Kalanchoe fedtschenkoi TaxID=63787 RepID=A0A7N0UKP7_KALFE
MVMVSLECGEGADSLLMCEEDNGSLVDGGGWFEVEEEGSRSGGGELLWGLLPVQSDECLRVMLEKEKEYVVGLDYVMRLKTGDLDLGERQIAVDWIAKAHAHFGFRPLCAYLAISFVDRFMSAYDLPKGKGWTAQLLAVACLSIAAKMEETETPFIMTLQACASKFIFEAKTIQRMELLVLSTLKWRMQAVTPFSFIDSFLNIVNGDKDPSRSLFCKSIKLISSTNKGIEFLEFRPSEIAAALSLSLTENVRSLSLISRYVEKERVVMCLKTMEEMGLISEEVVKKIASGSDATNVPQSPVAVLDRVSSCTNRSDETMTFSSSCVDSNKRRRLNGPPETYP